VEDFTFESGADEGAAGDGDEIAVAERGYAGRDATKTGCVKLHADYMIPTGDGAIINIVNQGTSCQSATENPWRILTSPRFEAPVGPCGWLNGGAYVGTLDVTTADGKPAVRIRIYKAS